MGVGGDRVEMYNMSSAMGKRWAEVCTEMTERIRALGPNPVRRTKDGQPETKGVELPAEVRTA